jgi:hypothetical protein
MSVSPRPVPWRWKVCHGHERLDRRVRGRAIPPRNVRELAGAFVKEWGNISQQELANLVQSMRR